MSPALIVLFAAFAFTGLAYLRARRRKTLTQSNHNFYRNCGDAGYPVRAKANHRRRALLFVAGILAMQAIVLGPTASAAGCGQAPSPERPGAGMVGAIDPPALDHGNPALGNYGKYSYAGSVWNVYQAESTPCIPDATATIDTWAGNQLFNVGKNLVGATNSLHYAMLSQDSMLAPLDKAVEAGAKTFYSNIYVEWFAVAALVLAVMLFRYIWAGDLASVGKRGLWALAGMWLAASVFAMGGVYSAVDSTLIQTTSEMQAGFITSDQAVNQRDELPNSLYDHVVYTNWLRGEFGDPNSPNAKKYGPQLLDDQAWTKTDVSSAGDQTKVDAKANDYKALPDKLGTDKGFFEGTDGSRTGSGFLAMFQGFAYALFQLLAKAAVLLAQVLIRVLILASPLIGLASMVMPDLLRKVARVAGSVVLTVLAFSAMAGAHALLLAQIFDAANKLSLIAQMLLATLVTAIFLLIGKPVRRMRQMVELSVGGTGLGGTNVGGGLFNRLRRGKDNGSVSPQEEFWANVSSGDETTPVDPRLRGRRARPEGVHGGVTNATATVLDSDDVGAEQMRQPRAGIGAASSAGYRGYSGASPALPPAGASRVAEIFPVTDNSWDTDESVVVPSQVVSPSGETVAPPLRAPRPAEPEMVNGEPVYPLYVPSTGLRR